MEHELKAILCDMDGTIINTEDISHNCFKQVCSEFGGKFTEVHHRDILGTTGDDWSRYLIDTLRMDVSQEEFRKRVSTVQHELIKTQMHLMPGFERLVELVKVNNIKFILVTSSLKTSVERNFAILNLENPFDAWVTADSVVNGKPNPEPFLLGAQEAGVEPKHCVSIEDSFSGVKSACGAGTHTCAIPGKYSAGLDFSIANDVFESLEACVAKIEKMVSS